VVNIITRLRKAAAFKQLGPGLITGAADDDPSGIATYSQAGAQFGYNMLWTMVFTYPLMAAVQLVSAEIGRVTGNGLAKSMSLVFPRAVVTIIVGALFVANTINIGADLAAMGEAAQLVVGRGRHLFTLGFAVLSLTLQVIIPYHRYAKVLKWLTLVLLAYVAVVLVVKLNVHDLVHGFFMPQVKLDHDTVTLVIAIFGTTISPYMFFWQSAQEVEDVDASKEAKPLKDAPEQAKSEFRRMKIDTFSGMAISNIVAIAIMISTAATLHVAGKTDVTSAAQAAEALKPIAGPFAFALFSLGIIGTGLLAVPILAGSAAYAVGESRGWVSGLEKKPWEATGFYIIIGAATLLGVGIDWSGLDPMKALVWSAVINGMVAAPVMAAMMIVVGRKDQMGAFTARPLLMTFGWGATAVMAAAAVAFIFFH
jgi:NRAMP (natural resistance-associated macrophage protein)-like metal ion transporter